MTWWHALVYRAWREQGKGEEDVQPPAGACGDAGDGGQREEGQGDEAPGEVLDDGPARDTGALHEGVENGDDLVGLDVDDDLAIPKSGAELSVGEDGSLRAHG